MPPQAAPLRPHALVMQQRLKRLTGHLFVAPSRLYFLCVSQKGGLAIAIGKGLGGLVGGAIAGLAAPSAGQAGATDEATLAEAIQQAPGSLAWQPHEVKQIKVTMWTRGLWAGGLTYALPEGLSKDLKRELGLWCQANNVKSAGLI